MDRIDLRGRILQWARVVARRKTCTISSVAFFGRNPKTVPGLFGWSLPGEGGRDGYKIAWRLQRTFCCPSDRKYDDSESDDDVEDLPHDGVG